MHVNACHSIKPNGFLNKIDIVNRNCVKKSKDTLDLHIFGNTSGKCPKCGNQSMKAK